MPSPLASEEEAGGVTEGGAVGSKVKNDMDRSFEKAGKSRQSPKKGPVEIEKGLCSWVLGPLIVRLEISCSKIFCVSLCLVPETLRMVSITESRYKLI